MMIEQDLAEWRAAGLKAGELYANDLAGGAHGRNMFDGASQRLVGMLGQSLEGEAQSLHEQGVPDEMIREYAKAAVEGMMVRLHAIRMSQTSKGMPN